MTLQEFFHRNPRAALAFSGGADSAYLLWAGRQWGTDIRPYYVHTPFQPAFELADARRLAEELDIPLTVIELDVLQVPQAAANGPRRCYYCKRALFSALVQRAAEDGYELLLDGSNASDDAGDRPGMQALAELKVRSPLRECGITKPELRRLSREAGLFTWDKPAYACLATRVPTGTSISAHDLARIEAGEAALAGLGFSDFRVRLLEGCARVQVTEEQLPLALGRREDILSALSPLFAGVLLDLQPRPGSITLSEEVHHGQ